MYLRDWSKLLCNGCYGRLLSLYEVKAGTAADDQKADDLARALLTVVNLDDQRRAEQRFRVSEARADHLSPEGLRFVATAEHVAFQLDASPQLEWSPAVIGLCKAVEAEIIRRILGPLSTSGSDDITADKNDKDVGRIARFCSDPSIKAPELGTFAHFLQTVINSENRRQTSPLMRRFLRITSDWTGAQWILDPDQFHKSLAVLTTDFRNRAAHVDELGKADYVACRRHVIGPDGLLWNIISSTTRHR